MLNSSVPNAWALPGGKIAVNRGLLTELANEAELAAVLGHEIVHAAARHGAQAQERGVLLQGGLVAAQLGAAMGGVDDQAANLLALGTNVGAQLVTMRYGRDAELQADLYGTRLMKAAGYDPRAAVTLAGNLPAPFRGPQAELARRPVRVASTFCGAGGQEPRDRCGAGPGRRSWRGAVCRAHRNRSSS